MPAEPCPDSARLRAFADGSLTPSAFEALAPHVADCAACGAVLDALRPSDLWAELTPGPSRSGRDFKGDSSGELGGDVVRFDRYELVEELGHGTFGWVFRAHDTELGRDVALKLLRTAPGSDPREVDEFLREAQSAAQLDHPGIVRLYDARRTEDGASYLVTELIDGETLARRLQHGRFEPRTVARWIAELADACQYMHERGLVHRDIKPSNVLIDRDGHPHLTDFGLARAAGEAGRGTQGEVAGTPDYMAPEQARDARAADAQSDVYSLGVVLFEALTGARPFQGDRRTLLQRVQTDDPPAPRELDPTVPLDLESVCRSAMARAPAERFASAAALAADLRRYLAGEPVRARAVTRRERLQRWCRRNPLAATLVAALVVGSVVGWTYLARLADSLVWSTATHSAALQAEVLEEVNGLYSELVDRLDSDAVPVTHRWAATAGALPLPATFTIVTGERLARRSSGVHVRLYSDAPFPWRAAEGGPRDGFERRALAALRAAPDELYAERDEYDGRPAVRLARARRMEESCLRCHNSHPESPKRDWQLGDVRGVLEIVRPLEQEERVTGRVLRGTLLLASATTVALALLGAAVIARGRPTAPTAPRGPNDKRTAPSVRM